jgi:serine phosphatase RsbU (regulator of sigma subunit)
VARERIDCLSSESLPIGGSRNVRPSICELPLESGMTIVMYTNGLQHAGESYGKSLDVCTTLEAMVLDLDTTSPQDIPSPQKLADALLANAIRLDEGRPEDDISVVVLKSMEQSHDNVRRMDIRFPVNLT